VEARFFRPTWSMRGWPQRALSTCAAGNRQTAGFRSGRPVSLVRKCALAYSTPAAKSTIRARSLKEYRDFDLRIVRQAWGIKLEIKNAPAAAFVDGVMIRGSRPLFAVLRRCGVHLQRNRERPLRPQFPRATSPMRYSTSCARAGIGAAGAAQARGLLGGIRSTASSTTTRKSRL